MSRKRYTPEQIKCLLNRHFQINFKSTPTLLKLHHRWEAFSLLPKDRTNLMIWPCSEAHLVQLFVTQTHLIAVTVFAMN